MDRRLEELANLRLALATFAIHLDTFEARLNGNSTKSVTVLSGNRISMDSSFARQIVAAMNRGYDLDS